MKEVRVYFNNNFYTGNILESEEACVFWLNQMQDLGLFQVFNKTEVIPPIKEMREVEVQPEVRDEDGNIVQERLVEMQEVVIQEEQTIVHPATHTYEIIDITEEVNREQALQRRMRLRQAGERLIDEMSVKNAELGLSLEQLKVIMLDEDAILVRELLWTGSLESAKAVIEEKRSKFEGMMGVEYVGWLVGKIDSIVSSA